MRIIDFHAHLGPVDLASIDHLAGAVRGAYGRLRESLPAGVQAALEIAGGVALPYQRTLRDRALSFADRALALTANRVAYLGRAGEIIARFSTPLLQASFLRGTTSNLLSDMEEAGVSSAVVLPVPPYITTEEVLARCRSPRLVPFCCPTPGLKDAGDRIARWKASGVRGIKVHPTIHGCPPQDRFYYEVAEAARFLDLPIVAHTGELDVGERPAHAAYSRPAAYEPLVRAFPVVQFVFAHMGFFQSEEALEVAARNDNVFLDTSWQPAGIVGRAFRRLGAGRFVFGSDWPFAGSHLASAVEVVARGLERRPDALERVLFRNAEDLLGSRSLSTAKS